MVLSVCFFWFFFLGGGYFLKNLDIPIIYEKSRTLSTFIRMFLGSWEGEKRRTSMDCYMMMSCSTQPSLQMNKHLPMPLFFFFFCLKYKRQFFKFFLFLAFGGRGGWMTLRYCL